MADSNCLDGPLCRWGQSEEGRPTYSGKATTRPVTVLPHCRRSRPMVDCVRKGVPVFRFLERRPTPGVVHAAFWSTSAAAVAVAAAFLAMGASVTAQPHVSAA